VLVTLKRVGGSKKIPLPTIPADAFEQWLRLQEASSEGVPSEGVFVEDAEDGIFGAEGGLDNDVEGQGEHRKRRRPSGRGQRSEEECETKFQTILYMCKRDPVLRTSFYDSMCDWQEAAGRGQQLRHPGPAERDRTRGRADRQKGAKQSAKKKAPKTVQCNQGSSAKRRRKVSATPSSLITELSGLSGDKAVRHIKRFGAKEGWVVEVYNDLDTDRWFMLVENGFTYPKPRSEDILIKACKWFKPNSVTELDEKTKNKTFNCDVLSVKAYGPPEYFDI
jgi:hypothetical protein